MKARRWRFWHCFQGSEAQRRMEAEKEIGWLNLEGFKAKVWAPLPEHKTSGHTHIVVLCTLEEKLKLGGIEP